MPEIFKFPIPEAYAEPINDGIKVTLIYPDKANRQYTSERRLSTPADIEFGIRCLEGLLQGDRVRIGTPEHPSRPASGGVLDLFRDGSFLTHRRDGGTKVHPWYNGIPSGFPSTTEDFNDISSLQRREGAEESLVFKVRSKDIAVPLNMQEYVHFMVHGGYETWNHIEKRIIKERARQLGIKNRLETISVEYTGGNDILEIKDTRGNIISKARGNIYLSWEIETNVAIAIARYWNMEDPSNLQAVDGEGFIRDGKFVHLNREKFHIQRSEVENIGFGQVIPMPKRYKLKITEEGIGLVEEISPEAGEVYRFKPDDGLRRMLDACGFAAWKGKWMQYERAEAEKQYNLLTRAQ